MEAAKQSAATVVTYSESEETEKDSPQKQTSETHSARQARVVGSRRFIAVKLTSKDTKKLGEEIFCAYKAKAQGGAAQASSYDNPGYTVTTFGSVHSKLSEGKTVDPPIVMDSGCSNDIIAKDIVRALGMRVNELERPLNIISGIKKLRIVQSTFPFQAIVN